MNTWVTLDKAGRVAIPKALRDELELAPGDILELENQGGMIMLRPARKSSALTREKSVWVFRDGEPLSASMTEAALKLTRAERDRENVKKRR
jgi:AbrB family looped-hinge helix DNA binding protein